MGGPLRNGHHHRISAELKPFARRTTGPASRSRRSTGYGSAHEAAPAEGRVAFLVPIAHAILGLRVGESAILRTARGDEELAVRSVRYEPDPADGKSRSTA
jgi:hypothetical protein